MINESESQSVVFFIDRCLGKHQIVDALKTVGATTKVHDDCFPQDALDIQWIPEVGVKQWIVLTKDSQIARNQLERQAIAYANIRMFTLVSKKLSGEQVVDAFKTAVPKMKMFIQQHPAPFIAKVYRDGTIKAWKKAEELLDEID